MDAISNVSATCRARSSSVSVVHTSHRASKNAKDAVYRLLEQLANVWPLAQSLRRCIPFCATGSSVCSHIEQSFRAISVSTVVFVAVSKALASCERMDGSICGQMNRLGR